MPPYDLATRLIHLGLALLGIAALVSGQFAGDYRRVPHPGFDIHAWIGLGMAGAVAARVLWGLFGPAEWRLSQLWPGSRSRLRMIEEDLRRMAKLELPMHEGHAGIAGLVQAIGLLAFAWMAVTGVILNLYLEPGSRASGWVRAVKELHEGGQAVVIGYLVLHVGAVLAHSLAGTPVWRRMFGVGRRP
jgi:cytochrome b